MEGRQGRVLELPRAAPVRLQRPPRHLEAQERPLLPPAQAQPRRPQHRRGRAAAPARRQGRPHAHGHARRAARHAAQPPARRGLGPRRAHLRLRRRGARERPAAALHQAAGAGPRRAGPGRPRAGGRRQGLPAHDRGPADARVPGPAGRQRRAVQAEFDGQALRLQRADRHHRRPEPRHRPGRRPGLHRHAPHLPRTSHQLQPAQDARYRAARHRPDWRRALRRAQRRPALRPRVRGQHQTRRGHAGSRRHSRADDRRRRRRSHEQAAVAAQGKYHLHTRTHKTHTNNTVHNLSTQPDLRRCFSPTMLRQGCPHWPCSKYQPGSAASLDARTIGRMLER